MLRVPLAAEQALLNSKREADASNRSLEAAIVRQYSGALSMPSYELDFFGKVRNASEAGLQTYLGTEEARRTQRLRCPRTTRASPTRTS
mgnify:CR=1 FL=1